MDYRMLAKILGISEEEARKLGDSWLNLADNVQCIKCFTIFQNWEQLINVVHDLTALIDRFGFKVEYDVPAGETKHHHTDLTDTDYCCMCPDSYQDCDLGGYMLLTNKVNDGADVQRKWQEKYPFIDEPMPSERQKAFYVEIPKRVVDVYFENTHDTDTGHARFYAEFDRMDFEKGKKLVNWFYSEIAKEFIDITEDRGRKAERRVATHTPHYRCALQGQDLWEKKGLTPLACKYCKGFYRDEDKGYTRHEVSGFMAPVPRRWNAGFDCPVARENPLEDELVEEG